MIEPRPTPDAPTPATRSPKEGEPQPLAMQIAEALMAQNMLDISCYVASLVIGKVLAARPQEQASQPQCNAGTGPVEECPAHGEAAKRFFGASQPAEAQDGEPK